MIYYGYDRIEVTGPNETRTHQPAIWQGLMCVRSTESVYEERCFRCVALRLRNWCDTPVSSAGLCGCPNALPVGNLVGFEERRNAHLCPEGPKGPQHISPGQSAAAQPRSATLGTEIRRPHRPNERIRTIQASSVRLARRKLPEYARRGSPAGNVHRGSLAVAAPSRLSAKRARARD